MCSQKRFSHASLPVFTKNFQNRIIMFCLELWYSREKYDTTDAAIQLSSQGTTYFQTDLWNFSSTGDSYFQIRTTKMTLWISYFLSFSIYLGFRIEVWLIPLGSCNPNLKKREEFSIYIFPTIKSLNLLWKHSLSLIKHLFSRISYVICISNMDFHIWY